MIFTIDWPVSGPLTVVWVLHSFFGKKSRQLSHPLNVRFLRLLRPLRTRLFFLTLFVVILGYDGYFLSFFGCYRWIYLLAFQRFDVCVEFRKTEQPFSWLVLC